MAQCLQELESDADTVVHIEFDNARYQARVNRERLVETLQPLYNKISAAVDASRISLVHKRLAGLPAFTHHLAAAGREVEVLDERAVFTGCMGYVRDGKAVDEGIYFVTQLKAAAEPAISFATTASLEQKPEAAGATHVLVDAEAHPLGQTPLYLSAQAGLTQSSGQDTLCSLALEDSVATLVPSGDGEVVFVNGRAVTGDTRLRPGDVVGFTGSACEFALIRVLE